jgi:dienelactone hydrolase
MTIRSFFVLLFFSTPHCLLQAQGYCSGGTVIFTEPAHPVAFDDQAYKTAVQIDEIDIPIQENVRLRVYYPADLPPGEKRPLIALVHGGYFISGNYLDFDAFARALAEKGFVAATIGYRLCKRVDCLIGAGLNLPCQISWNNSFLPSAYVAVTDVNDGLRWLLQRAGQYYIDPEKVVIAGHSAGAYTALNVAFLDQAEIQAVLPTAGVWPDYMAEPLDPIDGIRACIPMAGAFLNLDWIEQKEIAGENIAVGAIHGTSDGVVDYDAGLAIPCCQTYNTTVYGGCDIVQHVRDLGGNWYLLSGVGFGHDISEMPWYDSLSVQIPAFVIKTVICGEPVAQHSAVVRSAPLPMCPFGNPPLSVAPVCDIAPVTPGITVPATEVPGEQEMAGPGLLVYPNPATERVFFRPETPVASGAWQITVFSADGRLLRADRIVPDGPASLDVRTLAPGSYYLRCQSLEHGGYGLVRLIVD